MYKIPFNKPCLTGSEINYIREAFALEHTSGDGHFTGECTKKLKTITGAKHCLLTTSCTHALEMAALLLDLKPGDEVIIPAFTFVSTANAFVIRGAKPVFADIRPDTLNINEEIVSTLITSRTKSIVPVHYAGVACEMDAIMKIAERNNIAVVEDNAHGLFGKYKGKPLGSIGCMAAQSFHETKNISCGEGGALLINDDRFLQRAEIIREKGTNRSQFFRGEVDKYTWVDIGSSYLPSDILAAFLLAQLDRSDQIQARRQQIWNRYLAELADWADINNARLPTPPHHCDQAYHMFYLILPSGTHSRDFINHMKSRGILCVFHYQPLHISAVGKRFGGKMGLCPVTEDMSERIVRLPFYFSMTNDDQSTVIEKIKEWKA